ncbi:MAG: glycoside hydrolase family 2 TIM barrel-domain containing protein [Bacteroidota bacterium]
MKNKRYLFLLFCFPFFQCSNPKTIKKELKTKTKTTIVQTEDGYQLHVNGAPFFVKGAGIHNGNLEALARHGANAVRTWSTENGKAVLDQAHALGLKVMMGIWVQLERHGFDYDNPIAVGRQLDQIRKEVLALKDHPALMLWGIGNEMNLQSTNPKVWNAVNDISEMIHELDPDHLTTTSLAGLDQTDIDLIKQRAPDLDFICLQLYGPMDHLPDIIEGSGYDGPLMVTEWGATGYWEVPTTSWGAPIENNSSKKADLYLSRYQNGILTQTKQIMGSFVFLWGQKQERTPTWFGMFLPDGKETESVDVMHYVWNNQWPENRTPRLVDFSLDGKKALDDIKLNPTNDYSAKVLIRDPDQDVLNYIWEIREESTSTKSGGDTEYIPAVIEGLFSSTADSTVTFRAPTKPGAYRLFIYVEDGQNHAAHANIPFFVEE